MAYITLNKEFFFNNLDIIAQQSKGKDKIALVLKDNAYGHGLREIASMAAEYGITKAVVRNYKEAKKIADFFEYILVLADKPKEAMKNVCYAINDKCDVAMLPRATRVELKVNSGMNRNGIEAEELEEVFEAIVKRGLLLEGVFTHHACADELDPHFYRVQKECFSSVKQRVKSLAKIYGMKALRYHSCNSAALFRERDFQEDMARVGIAAYGCLVMPDDSAALAKKLQPVLSVYAKKISTRLVCAGSSVGYGATFSPNKDVYVSNYDFGYADGFLRSTAASFTTPQNIAIAGRISMDNSSFVSDKEELLVFNNAHVAAKAAGTISYEVLTALKSYLYRKIV
jgi:alanine racemase